MQEIWFHSKTNELAVIDDKHIDLENGVVDSSHLYTLDQIKVVISKYGWEYVGDL